MRHGETTMTKFAYFDPSNEAIQAAAAGDLVRLSRLGDFVIASASKSRVKLDGGDGQLIACKRRDILAVVKIVECGPIRYFGPDAVAKASVGDYLCTRKGDGRILNRTKGAFRVESSSVGRFVVTASEAWGVEYAGGAA
jgi:hypothetical protein